MRMRIRPLVFGMALAALVASCTPAESNGESTGTGASVEAGSDASGEAPDDADAAASEEIIAEIDAKLAELVGNVDYRDQNGVEASGFEATELSEEQIQQVRDMGLKAGIAMHSTSDAWSFELIAGLREQFEDLGIQVVGTTDAENDPGTQTTQIETLLASDPDIIVSLPTNPTAMVDAFRKAQQAGVTLVFTTITPDGFVGGEDYVAMVSDDRYASGLISGYQLAKAIGGKGKVALIYHDADNYTTEQSWRGAQDALAEFPEIEVFERGIIGPDFGGDAQAAMNGLLTQHPDLAGAWGVWDFPAEGIMAAARAAGRLDLKVTTIGFGENVAIALAKNELIVGLSAIDARSEGRALARLGALEILGVEDLPVFVASAPVEVNHGNVLDAWREVYSVDAPDSVASAYVE